jgi:hypothetical protein
MPTQQPDGDLLIGSAAIRAFLTQLGLPARTDPYYLRRAGRWPIGRTTEDRGSGGKLIASKRRLLKYIEKLTRGPPRNGAGSRAAAKLQTATKNIDMPPRRRERARKEATA